MPMSSELWDLPSLSEIEKVHLYACKRVLCVPSQPPNMMVYSKTGRYSLHITIIIKHVKYRTRLLHLPSSRLCKQTYLILYNTCCSGIHNWVSQMGNI